MGWAIAVHVGASDSSWAIAVNVGASVVPLSTPPKRCLRREALLRHCLDAGVAALKANCPAIDVVELVVRELENNPLVSAGRGSVLTSDGTVEMDACIMDGSTKRCGSVSGLSTVVNPISLARLVMERTPHIYLAFDGAEAFAREQGVEVADKSYFITPDNVEKLKQEKEANKVQMDYTQATNEGTTNDHGDSKMGTVGCVAVDSHGNLAAATSTGGLMNKMLGRIGDTPIVGAGTYANSYCAVSVTGKVEEIVRATVGRNVAALMEYKGLSLKEAAASVVQDAPKGTFGLIAVSAIGEVAMPCNVTSVFSACATEDGYYEIAK